MTHVLSSLDKLDKIVETTLNILSESFKLNNDDILHLTSFKTIMRFQQKDECLIIIFKEQPNKRFIKLF